MVTVDLRYVQTKSDRDKGGQGGMGGGAGGGGYYRPAKVERWADSLMSIVSDNFEVQCFKQRRRGATEDSPARQSVVFYGLLVNCQLAGYAYMVAFGRIHALSKAYAPPVGEWEAKQSAWGGGVGGTRLGSKVRERERERERERATNTTLVLVLLYHSYFSVWREICTLPYFILHRPAET
jgi:hypothetical protein